jgi:hypothetical protein
MTLTPAQKRQAEFREVTAPSPQPPAEPIARAIDGTRSGDESAERHVAAPADAGHDVEAVARHQGHAVARLPSQARTAEAGQDASGWPHTASEPINDLRDLDREGPRMAPGTPHPDRFLAERGWEVGRHGIYTRTGRHQPDREFEAG